MSHASVLWAQRKDKILLTIDVPDIHNEKVELTDDKLTFEGTGGLKGVIQPYKVELEFYKPVTKKDSKWAIKGKQVNLVIIKKEGGPHWPRLTKQEGKVPWLKADWNKWVDEDEEDTVDEPEFGDFGNFDMGGVTGGSGSDDEAEDDEEAKEEGEIKEDNKDGESKEAATHPESEKKEESTS